jgi:hypothetical protein
MRTPEWQISYDMRPSCHSWRIDVDRSVSAMVLLILLAALALWALIATVVELRRDGYRATPTDWTRVVDREPLRRAESGHVYR